MNEYHKYTTSKPNFIPLDVSGGRDPFSRKGAQKRTHPLWWFYCYDVGCVAVRVKYNDVMR